MMPAYARRGSPGRGSVVAMSANDGYRRVSSLPAWLILMGTIIPSDLELSIGGAKFTSGRIGVVLLLIPAVVRLFGAGRRLMLVDFLALVTGLWMIGAAIYVDGSGSLSSAGAEALEFVGGYFVARAFIYGPPAVAAFIKVMKICLLIAVAVAVLDNLSGRWVISDLLAAIFHIPSMVPQTRANSVRAISTFVHPILFGVFCSMVAAIVLNTEANVAKKALYVSICIFGAILSFSSAALMAVVLAFGVYLYNGQMRGFRGRWQALIAVLVIFMLAVTVATNHPLGWVLSHLTLDPDSSYFRLLIWDSAFEHISQQPIFGNALRPLNDSILDATTDSAWLVFALRYGIPMITLMFLMNVAAFMPAGSYAVRNRPPVAPLQLAFTTVLSLFMFVGLTVAYWNYMWIFWGVCIGIRASLREWTMSLQASNDAIMREAMLVRAAEEPGVA